MTMEKIRVDGLFGSPLVPHAVRQGSLLHVSGTLGTVDVSGTIPTDFEDEVRAVLGNMERILDHTGADFSHIQKLGVYLSDLSLAGRFNDVYREVFGTEGPARSTVGASLLLGASVEIDATAVLPF